MSRRKLIWHIGLTHAPRAAVPANLMAHRESLEAAGVNVAASAEEARLATHELLRTHRRAGLSRSDVEGRWARICDRVWQHKGVSLLSTPDLCAADKDQIRLALDPLIGIEVHLVVTLDSFSQQAYGGWLAELRDGSDDRVGQVRRPRARPPIDVRASPGRGVLGRPRPRVGAHPVGLDLPRRPAARGRRSGRGQHWREFLDSPVFVGRPRPVAYRPYADPAGRRRPAQGQPPAGRAGPAPLTSSCSPPSTGSPRPCRSRRPPRWRRWSRGGQAPSRTTGYDVRGDLAMLVDERAEASLPGPRDQLARGGRRPR